MLVYSGYGQTHLLCYRADRPIVHTPQYEGATALRRQRIEDRLEMAQFVTRLQPRLRAVVDADQFEIRDHFERHDPAAPRDVDHQVARDLEQIGAARRDARDVTGGIGTRHRLRHDIVDIVAVRQHAPQPRTQCAFVRQDRLLVPFEPGSDRFHRTPRN